MKSTTRNIFFAFGLIAVIVMLFTFKVSFAQLWADICHAGYWLFAIFGLWIFLYIMNACTWRIIIKGSGDCPIPFWKILKLTITGFALNYAAFVVCQRKNFERHVEPFEPHHRCLERPQGY